MNRPRRSASHLRNTCNTGGKRNGKIGSARKTGFIIGGTRGIGNAIALRMASLGMNLTVVARKKDELEAMQAQAEALGVRFLGIQASNTDFDAIAAAFETSWQACGRLDLPVSGTNGFFAAFSVEGFCAADAASVLSLTAVGAIPAVPEPVQLRCP